MILVIILIVSTLLGGLSINVFSNRKNNLHFPLIFAGSYLFAVTILHLIPDIFSSRSDSFSMGLYILGGFFLQQFLDYFSSGVEHGHIDTNQAVSARGRFSLIMALMIHSFLEGMLLTHDSSFHEQHASYPLLLGIILHKIPAAFALMSTLIGLGKKAYYLLILFSLASPIGLFFGNYILFSEQTLSIIFALVCGSFLHISTTIFVESSPNHHFALNRILISLLGALLALLVEYFM